MNDDSFVLIDTAKIDEAMAMRDDLLRQYDEVNIMFDEIVEKLLQNWSGSGANAFRADAGTVKTNIGGIYDILKIMCDTLEDCKYVIGETDKELRKVNEEA